MNNYIDSEIPKYISKKDSNISKSKKKAKHKHIYKECLIKTPFTYLSQTIDHIFLSSYCIQCGKIGYKFKDSIVKDYSRIHYDDTGKKFYSIISDIELLEKYGNILPVFEINNDTEYVPIIHD